MTKREEMTDNWYVVRVRGSGANVVMSASTDFEESYRDYTHYVRMNPDNYYIVVSENDLSEYFELVHS